MKLDLASLQDLRGWQQCAVALPSYDAAAMAERTKSAPIWVHFGAGNIFRGFVAALQQRLLNAGLADRGIIAAETFDLDIIDRIYVPCDNLTLNVTLCPDGSTTREIIASIAESVKAVPALPESWARMQTVFRDPCLQLVSYTITEKGYALRRPDGTLLPAIAEDIEGGPAAPRHAMSITAALLLARYEACAAPIAVCSMDNCSRNGEKLRQAILEIAGGWAEKGFVSDGFMDYLRDESRVSFPWSMIDKITPRPHARVESDLCRDGIDGMAPLVTSAGTYIAAFVNAEKPQYLVMEDRFPNGRPPLEKAGVYLTDRDTVNRTERMKVTTCLNPLHTAMSVYGCMLGHTLICEEMQDTDILALIRHLGYREGLPVVSDPVILSPEAFLQEVLEQRLPNPFMPDAPQRIATDTSQKVGIRFGETIKSWIAEGRDLRELKAIPLALAGWLRYLLAIDDEGNPFQVSADPLKDDLQAQLADIRFGAPESCVDQLKPILANAAIFGLDLTATPLAGMIEDLFRAELAGLGAVRATLRRTLEDA